ncbi:hypothetical protein EYB25_004520 [Talaromyces marneffei]|nr:hypothetical protein EYB25_004520 [Talaromyces marneffei]
MGFKSLIVLGLLPHLISVQAATCDWKVNANGGDTCASFAASWGLTLAKFEALNPGVACPGALVAGQSYCVMGTVPSGTTTSTASSTTTTTSYSSTITSTFVTTTSSSSQHQPTQTGLASNCNGFYLVSSGDTCAAIESKYGISAQEFASWNPAIDSGCSNLLLGYYVCVSVPGATTTTSVSTTTTSSPYQPTQSGLASNCNNFYLVSSGDNCAAIESKFGISAQQFTTWNPSIHTSKKYLHLSNFHGKNTKKIYFIACDNLYLGYYVCVGVPGATTTTAPPAPTSTAPSPEMPSTVSNCSKFHLVQSGDGCGAIEAANGITQDQFASWNPYIHSNCDNLWLGYYVCVGV